MTIKVNSRRQTGILHLPDDFAVLDKIGVDGYFTYIVKYSVDVLQAAQNTAFTVRIRVSNAPYAQRVPNAMGSSNRDDIVRGLLLGAAQRRDASRSFEANYVMSIQSDISSRISNSRTTEITGLANRLRVGNRGSNTTATTFGHEEQPAYSTSNTLALMSVGELNPQNIAHPIHQINTFKDNEFAEIPSIYQSRELAETLIYHRGVDPSSIAERTHFVASSRAQVGGLVTRSTTNRPTAEFQNTRLIEDLLRASLVGQQENPLDNQYSLPDSEKINVSVIRRTNFVDIEEELRIPVSAINDAFYLIYQLYDKDGTEIETTSGVVPHSRHVAILTIPTIPPKVTTNAGGSSIGSNVIDIKQVDPNAIGVYVYKRIMNRNSAQINAEYTLIKKLRIRSETGTNRVIDRSSNYNPTIYRVIPYNQYDLKGSEFSSVVVQSKNIPIYAQTSHQRSRTFVSIAYSVLTNGIRLEVNDIPTGPVALQLYRRNLSIREKNKLMVGETFLLNAHGNNAAVFFKDLFVSENRIYEYSVKLIYDDGTSKFSSTNVIVQFNPTTNDIISTKVSPPTVTRRGTDIDIQFNLQSTIVEGRIDFVRRAMQQQGILGFFQGDIASNRQLLQNLIGYNIIRTDVTTGEVEDFGVVIGTSFSDRVSGIIKGVLAPQDDHEYRYAINTHFRSAESLITTYTRTVQSPVNPNLSYVLTPSQWFHPVTLNLGNLVSPQSLQTNHAQSDFTFGNIANIQQTAVSLVQSLPTLSNGQCQKLGTDKIMVQWRVQGDIRKIDHFVVMLEILGMRTIVGKVHNISDSNLIQFIDKVEKNQHAEHTYFIVPVFYDYSRGTELKTNKVTV